MRGRAVRRHHELRMKTKVRAYYDQHAMRDVRAQGRLAHARTPCSCWMCGNPRRHFGDTTLQERRQSGQRA